MNTGGEDSISFGSEKYDDQGLFFSLVLGACLTAFFALLNAYLQLTDTLWLKRFYRPNHTVEPPPSSGINGEEPGSSAPGTPLPGGLTSPVREQYVRSPRSSAPIARRKRLGISLPYRSSLFQLPTPSDWWHVEEASVPHMIGALAPPERSTHIGTREFAPLVSPVAPWPAGAGNNNGSSGNSGGSPTTTAAGMLGRPRSYGAVDPATPLPSPTRGSGGNNGSSFSAAPVPSSPAASASSSTAALPKTPLDPQVALYLFTLKFFATVLLLGECFTIWICVISSTDDYLEQFMVRRDPHKCWKQDGDWDRCTARKPYCVAVEKASASSKGVTRGTASNGDDGSAAARIVCQPVGLNGIYDLTVQNLHPRSAKFVGVAILNVCFCLVFAATTILFVRRVSRYIKEVRAHQMRHAPGYRVACVRGIGPVDTASSDAFVQQYVSESAYFSPNGDPEEAISELACPGTRCLFSIMYMRYETITRADASFTRPESLVQVLFTRAPPPDMPSVMAGAEDAMAELQEAIAHEKALRRQAGYSDMPGGAARSMRPSRATSVVVQSSSGEYSPRSPARLETISATGSNNNNNNNGEDDDMDGGGREEEVWLLETRAPFPSCCHRIPAVPYYATTFRYRCGLLNEEIRKVPSQRTNGAAFVIFRDSLSAFEFVSMFTATFGSFTSAATARIAGPPGRIIQNALLASRLQLLLRLLMVACLYVGMVFFWSVPVGFLGSLENIALVPGIGPSFDRFYQGLPRWLRDIAAAYLPVIALSLFNVLLPFLIRFMVIAMGAFNKTECDGGHLFLQYLFMVLTAVVFQAALQGGLSQLVYLVQSADSEAVINFFVSCVTPRGGYWYAKLIISACLSTWMELVDPVGLFMAVWKRRGAYIQRDYDELFKPCDFQFSKLYSFDLMILSMGLLFHMTAPLLGLFSGLFFVVRYFTQRGKLYDRYRPRFSPALDTTDFGISAQVIRSVAWLFCLAETGAVLLMRLRKSPAGVVLCSLTLATSLLLLAYVYYASSTWPASLLAARQHKEEESQRRAQEQPAAVEPARPDEERRRDVEEEEEMHEYATQPLRSILAARDRGPSYAGQLLHYADSDASRYQPAHQRVLPMDAETEIATMKAARFIVRRYWDVCMTWFEATEEAPVMMAAAATARRPSLARTAQVPEASPPQPQPQPTKLAQSLEEQKKRSAPPPPLGSPDSAPRRGSTAAASEGSAEAPSLPQTLRPESRRQSQQQQEPQEQPSSTSERGSGREVSESVRKVDEEEFSDPEY